MKGLSGGGKEGIFFTYNINNNNNNDIVRVIIISQVGTYRATTVVGQPADPFEPSRRRRFSNREKHNKNNTRRRGSAVPYLYTYVYIIIIIISYTGGATTPAVDAVFVPQWFQLSAGRGRVCVRLRPVVRRSSVWLGARVCKIKNITIIIIFIFNIIIFACVWYEFVRDIGRRHAEDRSGSVQRLAQYFACVFFSFSFFSLPSLASHTSRFRFLDVFARASCRSSNASSARSTWAGWSCTTTAACPPSGTASWTPSPTARWATRSGRWLRWPRSPTRCSANSAIS